MCRLWATELSEIKPQLDANSVSLVGVGLEELGLDEFVKGEYFKGDLYIDAEKKNYKALDFKRYNVLTVVAGLAAKETRTSMAKSNLKKITGNFKGDGMQNGGLIVVSAGGEKVLLSFKQKSPGDHVENEVILNALGITSQAVEPVADGDEAKTEGEKDEGTTKSEAEGEKDEGKTTSEVEGEKSRAEGEKEKPQEEACGVSGGGGSCS